MTPHEAGPANNDPRQSNPSDESLPLGAIIETWWRQRVVILALILTGGIAAFLLAATLYLNRPVRRESILNFRLLFQGVEDGKYPNGERFSPSDIVSTAILQKVYDRDGLSKFTKFDAFKNSVVPTPDNPELNSLRREYEDRLAARMLSPIERQKLENEFREKAAALKNAEFTLILSSGSRFKSWPDALSAKILTDTLNIWLADSRDRGVFRFDFNVYSTNVLPSDTADEDYLIYVDQIRLAIKRIESNIAELQSVPGADLLRVGPNNISLGELHARLEDAVQYQLGTIESCIIQFGFFHNKELAKAYLRDQLFRLQLTTDELKAQIKTIEDVQTSYADSSAMRNGTVAATGAAGVAQGGLGAGSGTMIAQLSDTFLDRVMKLSDRSSDVVFRQGLANRIIAIQNQATDIDTTRQLYMRQLDALQSKTSLSDTSGATKQWMEKQLSQLMVDLRSALDDLQLFHQELSQRNLEPGTAYDLIGPVRQVAISMLSLGKILGFSILLGTLIVGTGVLIITWRGLHGLASPAQRSAPQGEI